MTNSLLDFVMSLVRDPDAAARYAADPSQAIADAHLSGVTTADVNGLIPVVSESLSMGAPGAGADPGHDSNVWASGAATAAFDAFSAFPDHVPDQPINDAAHPAAPVIDHPTVADLAPADTAIDTHTVDVAGSHSTAPLGDMHIDDPGAGVVDPGDHTPIVDHPPVVDHAVIEDHHFGPETPNFDIFE